MYYIWNTFCLNQVSILSVYDTDDLKWDCKWHPGTGFRDQGSLISTWINKWSKFRSCVRVEVAVPGPLSLLVLIVLLGQKGREASEWVKKTVGVQGGLWYLHSVTASPQPTDTQVARQNPTPLREARPLTQQLWFLTKGGITSLYHTGHFTHVFTLLTQQMWFRMKDAVTSLYHTGHLPRLHQWLDLTLLTQHMRFRTKDGITSLSHTGHFTQVTSVARYYTADSANVARNKGWHYLIIPHRALYPGYISGKILHYWLQMWFRTKGGITSLYHTGHFTQVITLLTQQTRLRTKSGITSSYHMGHFAQLHGQILPCWLANVAVLSLIILSARHPRKLSSTSSSANVAPNEGGAGTLPCRTWCVLWTPGTMFTIYLLYHASSQRQLYRFSVLGRFLFDLTSDWFTKSVTLACGTGCSGILLPKVMTDITENDETVMV